tara:strand:+ start:203 stop:1930 length:1728 start_codon:yes stop_codon:yes gene_type:complete
MSEQQTLERELSYRTLEFELEERSIEDRSVNATLSSENPVDRGEFNEILVHESQAINLERANKGLPLLFAHDQSEPIGVVDNIRIANRKLIGVLKMGSSSRAKEVWTDIQNKTLRFLSIGYQIDKTREEGNNLFVNSWTPYEASVVSVPADASVGINRSIAIKESKKMENELSKSRNEKEILAIGKHHNEIALAHEAVMNDVSIDEFRKQLLEKKHTAPLNFSNSGKFEESTREFSLGKAIEAQINSDWSNAGFEREVCQELNNRSGRKAQGIMIPSVALAKRTTLTTSNTSSLVGTEYMPQSFIDVLRPYSVAIDAGATTMSGLNQNISIPRMTAGASGSWIAEGASATESTPTFDTISLSPNAVSANVSYTRQSLVQMLPDVENLLRTDLSQAVATAIDQAVLNGSGASNEPTGILNTTGLTLVSLGTNGGAPTFSAISDLVKEVGQDNALREGSAFVTNAQVAHKLRTTQRVSGGTDATMISDNRDSLLGYRYLQSQNVPSNLTKGTGTGLSAIIFGDFSNVIIGEFGAVDLIVDPYSSSTSGDVKISIFGYVDIGIRHVTGFSAIVDMITT